MLNSRVSRNRGLSQSDGTRHELEINALTPLATHLATLFTTSNDLPYVTYAKEWARLSNAAFWLPALLSEEYRFNRELAEVVDENDGSKYQSRGVVNIQAQAKVTSSALSNLPLSIVHIYFPIGYLEIILPKLTSSSYRMRMDERQYGHQTISNPPNLAQTTSHHTLLPVTRMPDTPLCNEIYAAGRMNSQTADWMWHTNCCSIKLAVTMFRTVELERCICSLSFHRTVVPEPTSALAPVQFI